MQVRSSIGVLTSGLALSITAMAQVYVSPSGNDLANGSARAPVRSLERAVPMTRQAQGHVVLLRGGTYRLGQTLVLTAADSGLSLQPEDGQPVIVSGGAKITGWKADPAKPGLWFAPLPQGVPLPRQIYVDGVRANRTRGRLPASLTMNAEGYTADSAVMASWKNPGDLEFLYTGGNGVWGEPSMGLGDWTEPRCRVASISGATIKMAEPCWTNSTKRVFLPSGARSANLVGPASVGKQPVLVENAYELLGRPGEFYADPTSRRIYYTPREGEHLDRADVEMPRLERLLELNGSLDAPVKNISMKGITFAYAGWQEPSTAEGFSEIQANYRVTGKDGATKQALCTLVPGGTCPYAAWTPEPGNISARYADGIRFSRDIFTHMGAAGVSFNRGAHGNIVEGCVFTDISGNGLELGNVDEPEAADAAFAVGNRIENNVFRNVGAEFRGGIPIVVGYARLTHIAHNQIDHVPYAAISIGWGGWGDKIALPGVANRSTGNIIEKNRITRLMLILSDGGGIYTQGRTGNTLADGEVVSNNVIDEQFGSGHAIYTDNGSAMITVRDNVIFHTNFDNWGSRHKDYYDGAKGEENDPLAIEGNWWEQGDPDSDAKQVAVKDNHIITALAEAPARILSEAGLEQEFADVANFAHPKSAPEPPSSVSAFETAAEAYVTWRPPVFEGDGEVTSYTIRSSDGLSTTISADDVQRHAYVKFVVPHSSGPRTFTVTATNVAGTSAPSVASLPVTAPTSPLPLPSAPQSVSAHVEGTRASVHFGAPKEHGEDVIAYVITIDDGVRSEIVEGRREVALAGRHVTFVSLGRLAADKPHRFGVAAVTPWGTGAVAWSDQKKEDVPKVP